MSSPTPPWASPTARPRMSRRRAALILLIAALSVALVVVLIGLLATGVSALGLTARSQDDDQVVSVDLCDDISTRFNVALELDWLEDRYGRDLGAEEFDPRAGTEQGFEWMDDYLGIVPYRHPATFPDAPIEWTGLRAGEVCGATVVPRGDDRGIFYYQYVAGGTREQFEQASAILSALDYVMVIDGADRELLDLDAPSADEGEGEPAPATDGEPEAAAVVNPEPIERTFYRDGAYLDLIYLPHETGVDIIIQFTPAP